MVALIIIGIFVMSVIYAHSRGVEKQKISRQLFDHSTFMAPFNMFMTAFSRLPAKALFLTLSFSRNCKKSRITGRQYARKRCA